MIKTTPSLEGIMGHRSITGFKLLNNLFVVALEAEKVNEMQKRHPRIDWYMPEESMRIDLLLQVFMFSFAASPLICCMPFALLAPHHHRTFAFRATLGCSGKSKPQKHCNCPHCQIVWIPRWHDENALQDVRFEHGVGCKPSVAQTSLPSLERNDRRRV